MISRNIHLVPEVLYVRKLVVVEVAEEVAEEVVEEMAVVVDG